MDVGASVFLIAVGLILALAVHVSVAGIDIQLVGWILVAAGVIGLITSFVFLGPRRRRSTTIVDQSLPVDPAVVDRGGRRIVEERTYDDGRL